MNGLPYYKAYPRDFIEGTVGMPFEEKCAYRVILDLIYLHGGKLPDDSRYISGVLGCAVRKWNLIRNALVEGGKIQVNGEFIENYRAIIELEILGKFQDKQRKNATASSKNKDIRKPRQRHTDTEPDTYKKEEPKGSYKKTGSRLSADWSPSEGEMAFAVSEGIVGKALDREAAAFRDYWTSKTGASATKLDWTGTWRNWIRRAADQRRPRAGPQKPESAFMERQRAIKKDLERELGIAPKEPGFDNVIDLGQADYRTGWKA